MEPEPPRRSRNRTAKSVSQKTKAMLAELAAQAAQDQLLTRRMDGLKAILARPLNPHHIDFRPVFCSPISETLEGVYPEGTTQAQVLVLVDGPQGGRFTEWGDGRFRFIANLS